MASTSRWAVSRRARLPNLALGALLLASPGCAGPSTSQTRAAPETITAPLILTEPPLLTGDARATVGRVDVELCDGMRYGSGFFIDSNAFVTNRHVIDSAVGVDVEVAGEHLRVRSIEIAAHSDLARLRIGVVWSHLLRLAEREPQPGDHVRVVGYPRAGAIAATDGRIVGVDDESRIASRTLKTSAVVEPGNSGGPVLDDSGLVVGVATAVNLESGLAVLIPSANVSDETWSSTPLVSCDRSVHEHDRDVERSFNAATSEERGAPNPSRHGRRAI